MIVQEYMTPDPLVVVASEPISQIAELLQRMRIHQVPVVDESNRLVGIITDRDLRSAMGYDGSQCKRLGLIAEDIMTADVVTVTPGHDLKDALRILCHHRFGALPVVVGDHIVGILTSRDLMRTLLALLDAATESEKTGSSKRLTGAFF